MLEPRTWSPIPKPPPRQKFKRKPLKRGRVRKVSKKRARENRIYTVRRRAFLEAHPFCQAHEAIASFLCWPIGIGVPRSEEIHHTKKPKQTYFLDESTWLAVSKWSHRWIEDNKGIARNLGLLQ